MITNIKLEGGNFITNSQRRNGFGFGFNICKLMDVSSIPVSIKMPVDPWIFLPGKFFTFQSNIKLPLSLGIQLTKHVISTKTLNFLLVVLQTNLDLFNIWGNITKHKLFQTSSFLLRSLSLNLIVYMGHPTKLVVQVSKIICLKVSLRVNILMNLNMEIIAVKDTWKSSKIGWWYDLILTKLLLDVEVQVFN